MLDISAAVHKHLPKLVNTLPKPFLTLFIRTLQKIFHEKQFLDIYQKNHYLNGIPYVDSMLENLDIHYTMQPNELRNIPSTGKIIIIANHLTGGAEAMTLIQLIANAREDKKVKFIANRMLLGITQMAPLMIPVDNISGSISKKSLKLVYESLENNEAIIIFPAGVVSRLTWGGIKDLPWKRSFLKIGRKSQTPILPIKVEGRNSYLFYLLSIVLPKKITALLLPHEFATAGKRKPLHFSIGKVIPVSSFSNKKVNTKEYLHMFYQHLYALGTKQETSLKTETTIGQAKNSKQLKIEVENASFLGYTNTGKRIILAKAEESPFLLSELGRVRELSFRAIGGGTGNTRDNDLYDNYYKHLILWDDNDLEIVGAYRIGVCKDIIKEKGVEGLYTSNFCQFNEHFKAYHNNSIELGRSFVQPKYWGSRAFDSLWQAVTIYLAHNPDIQYSYGVVTINADTPQKAVAALVYFYTLHFACATKMMAAKTPYIMSPENQKEFDTLFKELNYKEGFIVLKKYLKALGTTIPTLFKQYIELYEEGAVRYFDFSVNEGLFGVTEGFIIADNYRMKKSVQERNLKLFYETKMTDSLSNLFTYEHFYKIASNMSRYQRKADKNFLLVLLSIDNFDSIIENNSFFSDNLIKKISTKLKRILRDEDIIARYDAEKFIILLPNIEEQNASVILKKIKENINQISVIDPFKVRCSLDSVLYTYTPNETLESALKKLHCDSEKMLCNSHILPKQESSKNDRTYP